MTTAETSGVERFDDERGTLLALELGDSPFPVERVFTVTAPGRPVSRGGHVTACAELIVLVHGSVAIRSRSVVGTTTDDRLSAPGGTCLISAGSYIEYDLETPDTTVLVLAECSHAESIDD